MEPKNHPNEKEHHLSNLHFLGSMLIFQGVVITDVFVSPWKLVIGDPKWSNKTGW